MRDGWRTAKLSQGLAVKHGFAFSGSEFSVEPQLPTVLTPGNFSVGGGFQEAKQKTYSGEIPEDFLLEQGDIVITMTDLSKSGATLGYSALVPSSDRYLHNQRIGLVSVLDESLFDPGFVHWLMRTNGYRAHVLAGATGSTVRHTSPGRILSYSFECPPLNEQVRIAGVLGALDDLIETNQRLTAAAEQLAGVLAGGAEQSVMLVELATTPKLTSKMPAGEVDHFSLPAFDKGRIPERLAGSEIKSNKLIVDGPAVLVSRLNPQTPRIWMVYPGSRDACASTEFVPLRPVNDLAVEEVWAVCASPPFSEQLRGYITGTTGSHQRVDKKVLLTLQVPDPRSLPRSDRTAITLLVQEAAASREQAQTLRNTRDELLPLLMSGAVSPSAVAVPA